MSDEQPRFHWQVIDYRKDRGERGRINRGFWAHNVPRLMIACRLLGHRPVVDGVDYGNRNGAGRRSRWACCNRCGLRLQQPIDSDIEIGQRYTDPLPSPPPSPRGTLGGQLVLLGAHRGASVEVKIGNMGSEHVLAGNVHLGRLGALYLHTEEHGRGLQRRLNPQSYDSRVVGFRLFDGLLTWSVWAKDGYSSNSAPKWQYGSVHVDPRDVLFGADRYWHIDEGEPVAATVRMPEGDDHEVILQLQRQEHGRPRLKRRTTRWCVDWKTPHEGIPTRSPGRGRIWGSGVMVSAIAAGNGGWVGEASAAIAAAMAKDRAREGFRFDEAEPA